MTVHAWWIIVMFILGVLSSIGIISFDFLDKMGTLTHYLLIVIIIVLFFILSHLCETQNGIPLTPLAIYLSKNISQKGEDQFKDELLVLGKTPEQINEWFDFYRYAESHASRTLLNSKIQKAIDQSTRLIMRYVQLAETIPNENRLKDPSQKMKALVTDLDNLLTSQPYLRQALEETSHFLYWDISEGDLG